MLSKEDNLAITQVGPRTLMGNLMRQYWVPALLSSELPGADSDPVRVMLLGEKLIAFRDSNGKVGLLENHCPHRGASLFFARNEECGLRCVYHGWKFDAEGNCVDMPNEPAESDFKTRVKATAYKTQERGGIIWAYLGPRETPPQLPDLEANATQQTDTLAEAIQRKCNWLQALEGDIDTSHFSFLHFGAQKAEDVPPDTFQYYVLKDRAPKYEVVDTDYGAMYGAYRPAQPGHLYWRIASFLYPFYAMIPPGVLGLHIVTRAWVPMDDHHTMFFNMQAGAVRGREAGRKGAAFSGLERKPNTNDWYGRFRLESDAGNDYRLDRALQRGGTSYTGIAGVFTEDQAVTESMGATYDRTIEHLSSADVMVIRVRRRLLEAARALAEHGTVPYSVEHPEVYRQRSGGIILPEDADWVEATAELRKAYLQHPSIDPAVAGRG